MQQPQPAPTGMINVHVACPDRPEFTISVPPTTLVCNFRDYDKWAARKNNDYCIYAYSPPNPGRTTLGPLITGTPIHGTSSHKASFLCAPNSSVAYIKLGYGHLVNVGYTNAPGSILFEITDTTTVGDLKKMAVARHVPTASPSQYTLYGYGEPVNDKFTAWSELDKGQMFAFISCTRIK